MEADKEEATVDNISDIVTVGLCFPGASRAGREQSHLVVEINYHEHSRDWEQAW